MGGKWAWDLDLSLFTSPLSIKFIPTFSTIISFCLSECQSRPDDLD